MKKGSAGRFGEIRESLSRLFMGRVRVHSLPSRCAKIAHLTLVRRDLARVEHLYNASNAPVMGSLASEWRRLYPRGVKLALASSIKVMGAPLEIRAPLAKGSLSFGSSPIIKNATDYIGLLPQTRRSRIRYLKERPFIEGSSLIALFSPIIKDAILRGVLDRERGVLFIWYDVSSDASLLYMLALFRRLDASQGDIFSWRWLPRA